MAKIKPGKLKKKFLNSSNFKGHNSYENESITPKCKLD
jgi:hypothetical protein